MNELNKGVRVTKPDIKIFIGDALTGDDAIEQAKIFYNYTEFDGVIMTKMDLDARGGSAISISYITSKPILYVGTGQGYDDLHTVYTVRRLSEDEMAYYREPFRKLEYRKPVWRWPNELPIEGKPEDVTKAVREYNQKLQISNTPKLLIYGEPGALITKPMVDWCVKNLSNLTTANIGAGIHYLQEDNPHAIGLEIAKWYETISR
jgi:SRP54-type protein, GTPase domain